MDQIKRSLWEDLERIHAVPEEVTHVVERLDQGLISGPDCNSCLIGTIAHHRGHHYSDYHTMFDFSRFENWLMGELDDEEYLGGIQTHNTPANNPNAAQLKTWLEEWIEEHKS